MLLEMPTWEIIGWTSAFLHLLIDCTGSQLVDEQLAVFFIKN